MINVLIWNEYIHEKEQPEVAKIYPEGIHKAIGNYLAGDELLKDTTYLDYTINSFDAQVDIEQLHTLPWEDTATVRVSETATIDGELPIALQTPEQLANPNKIRPPEWKGGTYDMTLRKSEERWIIVDVQEVEGVGQEGAQLAD